MAATLEEILSWYNRDFEIIQVRCMFEKDQVSYDELIGYCSYINGVLFPLDGDSYSLEEICIAQEYDSENDMLIVWEDCHWVVE